jgi:B12-binding domain/radical SAM domain protein
MKVNWRTVSGTKNSFAALSAACEVHDIRLFPAGAPESDITCYSLNSINEPHLRAEIEGAECITIAGGPHASACPDQVAAYADYVVIGEGERTLPRLIDAIRQGSGVVPPGVATRDAVRPVDHCVWLNGYPPFSHVKGYIEISRGCPHGCTYCQTPALFGRRMRHRSLDEIARYAKSYRDVRFITPNALAYGSDGRNPRLDKVEQLLGRLDNRIFFGTFPSEVRPEFITPESLDLISRYCTNRKLHFGAQAGNDRALALMRRGHSVDDVIRAVELCREYDIVPVVDFIVGLPFESEEDQRETVDLIRWVARFGKVHAHHFTPLPGTPLAHTKPRAILPGTKTALGRLALAGRVTGSWIDSQVRFFRQDFNE